MDFLWTFLIFKKNCKFRVKITFWVGVESVLWVGIGFYLITYISNDIALQYIFTIDV